MAVSQVWKQPRRRLLTAAVKHGPSCSSVDTLPQVWRVFHLHRVPSVIHHAMHIVLMQDLDSEQQSQGRFLQRCWGVSSLYFSTTGPSRPPRLEELSRRPTPQTLCCWAVLQGPCHAGTDHLMGSALQLMLQHDASSGPLEQDGTSKTSCVNRANAGQPGAVLP